METSGMSGVEDAMNSPVQIEFLLPTILVAIAVLVGSILFFVSRLKVAGGGANANHEGVHVARGDGEAEVRAPPRGVRAARDRMVRQAFRQQENEDDNGQPEEEFDNDTGNTKKIGAKKARKLEMKAEKQAQREQDLAEREERRQRQEVIEEQRKKEADREQQAEQQNEVEEKKKKEEEEEKEHEAYLALKASFEVHQEGFQTILTESESQNLLQEFVNYIKMKKVVLLEDLAAEFNMKTQDAIQRVHELQDQDLLTGVIDDRGKYIFISQDELEGVAKFMRQRGRVSISELAEASNTLIFLNTENDLALRETLVA